MRVAEKLRDLGWDPPGDAYLGACALALCIPIVADASKQDVGNETRFYADEAMKMLHDAVAKGYRDVEHAKADSDLAPLRDRDDFKKLLTEMEAKAKK